METSYHIFRAVTFKKPGHGTITRTRCEENADEYEEALEKCASDGKTIDDDVECVAILGSDGGLNKAPHVMLQRDLDKLNSKRDDK
jgi:hypothetical protein